MRVRVKICGITTTEAAAAAAEAGVDAVGYVFADSPRRVRIEQALALSDRLGAFVTRVAVFRYPAPDEVGAVVRALRPEMVQSEPAGDVAEAIAGASELLAVFHDTPTLGSRVREYVDQYLERCKGRPAILLEAPGRGGRGIRPSWDRAAAVARDARLVLAGGLTPENVADAIRAVRPYAVDVSTGVEGRPGVKDPARIEAFMAAVRRAEADVVEAQESAEDPACGASR